MITRRCLLGSMGALTLARPAMAATGMEPVRAALQQAVGARADVAGMVAVIIDETGSQMVSHGSSGVPGLALDGEAVFEIMSNTKVLTSLLLAEMAGRGEVGLEDPVTQYLPSSLKLPQLGGPIRLVDLATYTSGLPNMPDNLPRNWWALPNPLADYTQDQFFSFLSHYTPKYAPGTHYEYANAGFGLLGIALARRAGMTYEELLIERVCAPLGMAHTRINLSDDMRRHLVQGHDLAMKPTQLWDFTALPGAGYARSTANDLTVFIKACLGLVQTPLSAPLALMRKVQRPTPLSGTNAGMGWYITQDRNDQIVWKSGLSAGCNTFIGYAPRRRRGVVLLANFLSRPIDAGLIAMGVKLVSPDFAPVDFDALYPH